MVKRHSSLQRIRFHCSRVQWRWPLHHSSQLLALCIVILGLCAAARPWKPISWRSQRTVFVLTFFSGIVWNSVVSLQLGLWPYYSSSHESWIQSNSNDLLVTVIRHLQALLLLLVISSLPNLHTALYSALYCPSNNSDINANVFENLIKHLMWAHALMLRNFSVGYAIAGENRVMTSIKKKRIPSAFYRLGLLYLLHIAYIYKSSTAYLAGMKINNREKRPPLAMYLFRYRWMIMVDSKSKQMSHVLFSECKDRIKSRIVWWVTILAYHLWMIYYHFLWLFQIIV